PYPVEEHAGLRGRGSEVFAGERDRVSDRCALRVHGDEDRGVDGRRLEACRRKGRALDGGFDTVDARLRSEPEPGLGDTTTVRAGDRRRQRRAGPGGDAPLDGDAGGGGAVHGDAYLERLCERL